MPTMIGFYNCDPNPVIDHLMKNHFYMIKSYVINKAIRDTLELNVMPHRKQCADTNNFCLLMEVDQEVIEQ